VTGLGGQLTYQSISGLTVPAGGSTRDITVTVTWQLAGQPVNPGKLDSTYALTVVDQGGKWFVKAIKASVQAQQAGNS
jgi:hypothetical protein